MFSCFTLKAVINEEEGEYGTSKWGYYKATVSYKGTIIHETDWLTGGAKEQAEYWCKENGYKY